MSRGPNGAVRVLREVGIARGPVPDDGRRPVMVEGPGGRVLRLTMAESVKLRELLLEAELKALAGGRR